MSSRNDCGFSFRFELPSEDLALRGVAIEDGTPKLIFDASMKVPTLTEEDVGIACRLACDGKRPEFFYYPFPLLHPYHGRWYKHYSPEWLKGTSVGELLSEVDWTMKCLNIGARSDETKEKFWAWRERTKLKGLADRLDFPEEMPRYGAVQMSCDSVKVYKKENEMIFLGEPKMRITDRNNFTYSKYITDIYPSIAYYDEPLFLKIQELIKLILAAEWMKEKRVRFSRPWMMACSNQRQETTQAIEVKSKNLSQDEVKELVSRYEKQLPTPSCGEVMTMLGPSSLETALEKNVTENGFEIKVTRTAQPFFLDSWQIEQTTIIKASSSNYNMLYSGMDPNMTIFPWIPGVTEAIVPNVQSWSELFAQTVPIPRTWLQCNEDQSLSTGGGVATRNIPVVETAASKIPATVKVPARETVRQDQFESCRGQLHINAKREYEKDKTKKKVPTKMVPQPQEVRRPDNNVTSKTEQTRRKQLRQTQGLQQAFGYEDPGSGERVVCSEQGQLVEKKRGMRQQVHQRTVLKPKKNTPPISQPLRLREQQVAPPKDLLSPSSSVTLNDSGIVSNPPNPQKPPIGQQQRTAQPTGATNDLLSPSSSAASNDSGFISNPPNPEPLPLGAKRGYKKDKTKKEVPTKMVPQPQEVRRPDNNVTSKTEQTRRNQPSKERQTDGYEDPGSGERVVCSEQGQLLEKKHGMRQQVHQRTVLKPNKNTPPISQPLRLREHEMAPPIDLLSPSGSVALNDSGFVHVSNQPNPQQPLLGQQQQTAQPEVATNDLLAPSSSVNSNDSGFISNPPNPEPLPLGAKRGYKKDKTKKKVPTKMVSQLQEVRRSDNNVTSRTEQTRRNQPSKERQTDGYEDPGSGERVVCSEQGQLVEKKRGMRQQVHQRTVLKPNKNTPPISQPLRLREQQVHVAPPKDLLSPSSSVPSNDSGIVSNPPNRQPLPLKQQQTAQPAGATNDLFSPTDSVASDDSGIVSNPPNLQPPPIEQPQIAQPADDLFSPSGSVISNDSGFSDGQSNHNQQVHVEEEHSKPAEDKDDSASSDSGNDSNGSFEGADN